jgi:hypothetical protein
MDQVRETMILPLACWKSCETDEGQGSLSSDELAFEQLAIFESDRSGKRE